MFSLKYSLIWQSGDPMWSKSEVVSWGIAEHVLWAQKAGEIMI